MTVAKQEIDTVPQDTDNINNKQPAVTEDALKVDEQQTKLESVESLKKTQLRFETLAF